MVLLVSFLKTRYEYVDGEFREAEALTLQSPGEEGQTHERTADIYQIEIDVEIVLHIGIMPGCKVNQLQLCHLGLALGLRFEWSGFFVQTHP